MIREEREREKKLDCVSCCVFIFFWVVNVVSGCIDLIDCGLFLDGIATTSSLIELLG